MIYHKILERAKSRKKATKSILARLKKMKSQEADRLIHENHDIVFREINCLNCANCCKTTGPLFISKDIERIARYEKLKPGKFIDLYLRLDEDNDYVLKVLPCKYLDEQNKCTIYSIKPKACGEYPHTDRKNMNEISELTYQNSLICPAVSRIMEEIEKKIN